MNERVSDERLAEVARVGGWAQDAATMRFGQDLFVDLRASRAELAQLRLLVNAGAKLRAVASEPGMPCMCCYRSPTVPHEADCAVTHWDRALAEARAKGAEVAG